MCGISGIISREGVTPDDLARVASMSRALVHRGPDDSGVFSASHIALASRRLSIIDLGGGRQPLYNEDRTLALVANGEIYNHAELRRRLEARGHRFTTGSDCEASSTLTPSSAPLASSTCGACSPSPCGTARGGDSCWRATP
jgi:asparagine synthase (glutamine-hydrolysing)